MPTKDGEKPHVVVSDNRANDAVTYPWVHVIWMGTNLARARSAEHVVLAAADHPLVGFVDCMTLRLASKRHLVRRVGRPVRRYHEARGARHPSGTGIRVMSSDPVDMDLTERPPASVEDYNQIGREIPEEDVAAVEAAALQWATPAD